MIMVDPRLIVSCINGKSAKAFCEWAINDGNADCGVRTSVVSIPTGDLEYAKRVVGHAFQQGWITNGQLAHALTNFQNVLDGHS